MDNLQAGAPSYPVLLGRRDGLSSDAAKVDLPSPSISWESALAYFKSKGLDVLDLATLLGKGLGFKYYATEFFLYLTDPSYNSFVIHAETCH